VRPIADLDRGKENHCSRPDRGSVAVVSRSVTPTLRFGLGCLLVVARGRLRAEHLGEVAALGFPIVPHEEILNDLVHLPRRTGRSTRHEDVGHRRELRASDSASSLPSVSTSGVARTATTGLRPGALEVVGRGDRLALSEGGVICTQWVNGCPPCG
jgi:hypothetical protein